MVRTAIELASLVAIVAGVGLIAGAGAALIAAGACGILVSARVAS